MLFIKFDASQPIQTADWNKKKSAILQEYENMCICTTHAVLSSVRFLKSILYFIGLK